MKTKKQITSARIRRRLAACLAAVLLLLSPTAAIRASAAGTALTETAETRAVSGYSTVPVYIDGVRCPSDAYIIENGVTYLPLRTLANHLLTGASVYWDSAGGYAVVKTEALSLTARPGDCYITANGRYLALSGLHPAVNTLVNGVTYVPLRTAVRAMGGQIEWNANSRCVEISRGTGTIADGSSYYREDEVYWLSRIIYAESGAEPLRGQLAVGSVVMNRVMSGQFPNTIYSVIFDRKWGVQFTPTANGAIYKKPSAQSIIAAKLILDGCRISTDALYFLDPRQASSFWIVENRQALFSIGCHDFYS
ncbi:MAG: copper amine oxidase [Ruminococcaceae bacterium]|nr:copper amine oxidase [Oscillospiraceae bacterium]